MQNTKKRPRFLNLTQDLMFKTYFSKNKEVLKSLLNTFLPLLPGQKVEKVVILEENDKKQKAKPAGKHRGKAELAEHVTQATEHDVTQVEAEEHVTQVEEQADKQILSLQDSSLYPIAIGNKQIVLDLRVRLNTGEAVNVEIQSVLKKGFLSRVLFYWARLYTEDLKKSADYGSICPVYSLIFTDFDVFKPLPGDLRRSLEKPTKDFLPGDLGRAKTRKSTLSSPREEKERDFINSFSVRLDKKPHFPLNNDLRIVFVELSKFYRKVPKNLDNIVDLRDLWCYLLKESGRIGKREWEILSNKGLEMRRAMEHLKDLSQDEVLRREEEAREKFLRDQRAEKAYAFDQGMEKGMQKGILQGMQKGILQGMQKGREEQQRILIFSMLKNGASISFISQITGLSSEEIKKLKDS